METWNKLPFIVRTGSGHRHYFAAYREAGAFCDWLLSLGLAFSLTVKD